MNARNGMKVSLILSQLFITKKSKEKKKEEDFNKDANNSKGDGDISLKLSRYIIYCVGGDDKYKKRWIHM
jgi:hypothetical protein